MRQIAQERGDGGGNEVAVLPDATATIVHNNDGTNTLVRQRPISHHDTAGAVSWAVLPEGTYAVRSANRTDRSQEESA